MAESIAIILGVVFLVSCISSFVFMKNCKRLEVALRGANSAMDIFRQKVKEEAEVIMVSVADFNVFLSEIYGEEPELKDMSLSSLLEYMKVLIRHSHWQASIIAESEVEKSEITIKMEDFLEHLRGVYEKDRFFGEPMLEELLKHSSELFEAMASYEGEPIGLIEDNIDGSES